MPAWVSRLAWLLSGPQLDKERSDPQWKRPKAVSRRRGTCGPKRVVWLPGEESCAYSPICAAAQGCWDAKKEIVMVVEVDEADTARSLDPSRSVSATI